MAKASLVDRIEYAQMASAPHPPTPHLSGKIKKHGHINRSEIFRNFVSFFAHTCGAQILFTGSFTTLTVKRASYIHHIAKQYHTWNQHVRKPPLTKNRIVNRKPAKI